MELSVGSELYAHELLWFLAGLLILCLASRTIIYGQQHGRQAASRQHNRQPRYKRSTVLRALATAFILIAVATFTAIKPEHIDALGSRNLSEKNPSPDDRCICDARSQTNSVLIILSTPWRYNNFDVSVFGSNL